MTRLLVEAGHAPVVLDDLSSGHRDAVMGPEFVEGDAGDAALLERVFAAGRFAAVMHFASCIDVGESVADPARYYRNNVANTVSLLDAMNRHRVRRLVFSSTAAVFAESDARLTEDSPVAPATPYGRSKLMVEQMLADYDRAYGLRHSCLRYFNAAGAEPDGALGERHEPETHLIPLALQVAAGRRAALEVFGTDYATPDGTCIRDYVHVVDLCRAHLLALRRLTDGGESRAYNLGNGDGYSVRQVIDAVRKVTGRPVPVSDAPRRVGDAARLVADATRAARELDWRTELADLETMIRHAWNWETRANSAPAGTPSAAPSKRPR
jgi:UDP-glucose 4-epimerase